MHLALDDHRVDAGAAIVQRIEAPDLVDPGIDVDVHHADISTERIGHVGRIVIAHRLQPRLHARRHGIICRPADILHRHGLLRQALDAKTIDIPFEIVFMHLELVGGDHLRFGLDLSRGHGDRGAGDRRRARTVSAEPVGCGIGIAFLDHDVVGWDADLGRDDLRPGGFVALALALGAHPRYPGAGRMHADFAGIEHRDAEDVAILRRAGADDLGEERDADAHDLAGLAALEPCAFFRLLLPDLAIFYLLHPLAHPPL